MQPEKNAPGDPQSDSEQSPQPSFFTLEEFKKASLEERLELFGSLPNSLQNLLILLPSWANPIPRSGLDNPDVYPDLHTDQVGFEVIWQQGLAAGYLIPDQAGANYSVAPLLAHFINGPYQKLWDQQRGQE